jgi:hypothetical protein
VRGERRVAEGAHAARGVHHGRELVGLEGELAQRAVAALVDRARARAAAGGVERREVRQVERLAAQAVAGLLVARTVSTGTPKARSSSLSRSNMRWRASFVRAASP